MEKILVLLFLCLLAATKVDSLRCWRCSSDITNGEFCRDPFNKTLMTEVQQKWSYVDCTLPTDINTQLQSRARPVCKKIIQQVREKIVFARACSWELEGASSDECKYSVTPPDVKMLYCETCRHNGCNGENDKILSIYDPNRTTTAAPTTADSGSGFIAAQGILIFAALVSRFM